MIEAEILGWVAAVLTLSASSMRTMLPLRIINIAANLFFVGFGVLAEIYPTLVLHALLLPLNIFRLSQILVQKRRLERMRRTGDPIEVLGPLMRAETHTDGSVLFTRGDAPDRVYYIEAGQVSLPEIDVRLGKGELFGEMAYFSNARQRTTSAICQGDCRILVIDEQAFARLYHQSPVFGMYILKTIARRLIEGSRRRPELYDGFTEAPSAPGRAPD
ncbi:DNA-binding transcriptional dual regulator Crp [Roseivivax jejudonensis]|uniref:DNA-binding transcriptional dual regulator Crp n=1 Tax=Roseivivax jejudonensis TaxID=1529041 RepID=A0A1X6YW61_9RHOB|nr:cyclic nucleotide-binding domain-containing protein [Roseivivax jejudonensis]SLN32559.1 DNA-binding transcriptional dual regulator Crp [Roseivivax jejudonensis]